MDKEGGESNAQRSERKVPRQRVAHTLSWVLELTQAAESRAIRKRVYLDRAVWGQAYTIIVDAPPWGGGAFLSGPSGPVEYLSTAWGDTDARELGLVVGSNRFQATFEALAILVAVRAWKGY